MRWEEVEAVDMERYELNILFKKFYHLNMSMLRKTFRVKMEILSPLFIGSGKEYMPDEYFIITNTDKNIDVLHRFDTSDVFEVFSEQEKQEILQMNTKPLEMRKKMNDLLKKYFKEGKISSVYSVVVNKETAKTFYENINKGTQNNNSNKLAIKEFIQNSFGKKYIPGSSIKGAIRTAMQESNCNNLMVTDSENVSIENFKIVKLKRKGGKAELPVDYEVFPSGGTTEFCIKLRDNEVLTKEKIQKACNQYAKEQIEYSLRYIGKRAEKKIFTRDGNVKQKENKKEAYQSLKNFFTEKLQEKSENSFLLNLGFGGISVFKMLPEKKGGKYFWSVKGGNIVVEHFPSTFWMTETNQPLGWVKCTFLD